MGVHLLALCMGYPPDIKQSRELTLEGMGASAPSSYASVS
jgi:hypothetical protein